MIQKILLAIIFLLSLSANSWAITNWVADATCEFAYLFTSDQNPGTTITDSTSNSNDGAAEGADAPNWDNTSGVSASGFSGGGHVDFTDDYIKTTVDGLYGNYMSIVWYSEPSSSDADRFWQYKDSTSTGTDRIQAFRYEVNDSLGCQTNGDNYSDNICGSTDMDTISGWHHWAIAMDNTQAGNARAVIYLDGVAENYGSCTNNYSNGQGDANVMYIGQRGDGNASLDNVDMDEFAFFTSTLDSTDVNDIMDNGLYQVAAGGRTRRFF